MSNFSPPDRGVPVIRLQGHSAVIPDWSREACERFWQPSRRLLRSLREYSAARERGGLRGQLSAQLAAVRHRFWSLVTGADIPLQSKKIGGGLLMPHPHGIVVHPDSEIGPNCIFFQQVTVSTGPRPGAPRIGGHVDVGAGAKILGGVVVGDHAVIGANAVVISDVPPFGLAIGVPAVVRQMAHDRSPIVRQRSVS